MLLALLVGQPLPGWAQGVTQGSAFRDFWWNGLVRSDVTSTNHFEDWTNPAHAKAQGRATNPPVQGNAWSYGSINCMGGDPETSPYPTRITGTITPNANFTDVSYRAAWNQFSDLAQKKMADYDPAPPFWVYRNHLSPGVGVEVGWFGSAWNNLAPGYDGKGMGRNGLSTKANSNTRYLWLKPAGSVHDGDAAAVRWTAMTGGTYRLEGEFLPGGEGTGTMSVAILTEGTGVTKNVLLERKVLSQDGPWETFDLKVKVGAGQTVSWVVGTDGDSAGDVMGLQVEITKLTSK
jgi:hypothetical protein